MFTIADDGSLDTLVRCDECGAVERYDSQALLDGAVIPIRELESYRIKAALDRALEDHECEGNE